MDNSGERGTGKPSLPRRLVAAAKAALSQDGGHTPFHIARDAVATLGLNLASVVLSFVLSVILSRLLGRRGFGAYVIALAWAGVLTIPALFGTVQLLIRNITYYRTRRAWGLIRGIMRRCNTLVLLASTIVVLVAAVGGTLVMAGRDLPVRDAYLLALLLVPLLALINLRQAEMIGFQRIALGRFAETVAYPLFFLGLLATLYFAFGVRISPRWAVGLNVGAAAAALLLGSHLARTTLPAVVKTAPREYERDVWSRSTPALLLIAVMPALNAHSGTILLGLMADVDSAAVFNAAVRWATFTGFLQWASAYPLGPAIARLYATGEIERLERLLFTAAVTVLVLSTPLALGLLLFGRRALTIYGPAFASGRTTLSILVVGEVINLACGLVGVILIMTGNERTVATAGMIAVAANIALCVALIPPLGSEGAAIARASTTAVLNVALLLAVWRRLHIYPSAIPRFRTWRDRLRAPSGASDG